MRRTVIAAAFAAFGAMCLAGDGSASGTTRKPNILFAIADDWGFPHASCLGDPVVKTPAFDRVAREGVLFRNAYVSAPSCTPCRGSILTGQWFWRLEGAANLWSVFPDKFTTYPEILERAGYVTGYMVKGWGPGKTETPGRNLCGPRYRNFKEFLEKRPRGKPFCFWLQLQACLNYHLLYRFDQRFFFDFSAHIFREFKIKNAGNQHGFSSFIW